MAGRPPLLAPDERTRRIESAATEVFAEMGFAAATMDEIALRSGVSKPALYRVFQSKSHLFASVIERHATQSAEAALAAFAAGAGSMRERLVDMIDAWFARVEANPNVHRLAAHHLPDDAIIAAAAATIRTMQLANDARLISSIAPHVPREEIEPLGEVVRGALLSLADWWVDHPDVSRSVPVAVMCRVCNGLLLPIAEPAVPSP